MTPFESNGSFRPREEGIRRVAVRGAGATMLSSGLGLVIQIVASGLLARLLTPADFGLVTMVSTFSLLLMNVGLNGFTEAVIQREEIDRFLISNLFWINVGVGTCLAVGFAGAGSLLASFYGDPRVATVAIGMSATIVLTSTSVLHLALLKRAMRFSLTSVNDIISRAVSLAVSIGLAWFGWGYWALVGGAVAQPISQAIGAWCMCRWIPDLPRRANGTAAMVRFAIHVYGSFGINYLSRNVDNLLVGWRFSAGALGFYKKAYDLFALPASQSVSPLTNVAVAALSRFRKDSAEYKESLLGALGVIAFVGMGLGAALTLTGKDVIRILLGAGWESAGQIFTFFGPGIGVMLLYYTHGWIHLSIGRADRWLRWGIVEFAVTFLLFLVALPWGPLGIAGAWTVSFWILAIPAFWYAGRPIGLRVRPIVVVVWRYPVASVIAALVCAKIIEVAAPFSSVPGVAGALYRVVSVSGIFVTLYCGVVMVLYRGLAPFHQLVGLLHEMIFNSGLPSVSQTAETVVSAESNEGAPAPSKPLVSILIPAYNAEAWIADTLRSAIAQTWAPKEIIVVDDGSTDRTLSIARQFASDVVRVVTQRNQGASATRNHAFSISSGEYIQWLDADDLLAPDKIAWQMKAVERCGNPRTLFSSAFGLFRYRHHRASFVPTALWCDLSPVEWLTRKMSMNLYMQTATWLVSRQMTEAAGPWDTSLLSDDDGEYFCRVLLASDGVRFVPEARVYYRAPWPNSLSNVGRSAKKIEAHWRSMRLHIEHLRSLEDSERTRRASVRYLQVCFEYFYPEMPEIVKEVEALAKELGGKLEPPHLSWKYSWIRLVFGWDQAKRIQIVLPRIRWWFCKCWDIALYRLGDRFSPATVHVQQGTPEGLS